MSGRAYYLTTLGAWREQAQRFGDSHWIAVELPSAAPEAQHASPNGGPSSPAPENAALPTTAPHHCVPDAAILALIDADEGVHLALEHHPAFAPLPHPLSPAPVSGRVTAQLAAHEVPAGATTFEIAEILGRTHPLLRFSRF